MEFAEFFALGMSVLALVFAFVAFASTQSRPAPLTQTEVKALIFNRAESRINSADRRMDEIEEHMLGMRADIAMLIDEVRQPLYPADSPVVWHALVAGRKPSTVTTREAVQALYRHLGLTASKQPQGPAQVTVRPLDKLVINKPKRRRR